MSSYTSINNFSLIPLLKNTIYVIDIDETLFYYEGINEKWWDHTISAMTKIYDTYEEADKQAEEIWYKLISKITPILTDPEGFLKLRQFITNKKNNCHLFFLTARLEKYKEITEIDMNSIIPKFNYPILYFKSLEDNKGVILKNYLNENSENPLIFSNFNNIIFVDDREKNLKNVSEELPQTKCFLYNYSHL